MTILKSIFSIIKTTILSLFLICLVIFMVNNRDAVTIHLHPLPFDIETRIFVVMIVLFVCGLIFGLLACSQNILSRIIAGFQDKNRIKKLEKRVKKS